MAAEHAGQPRLDPVAGRGLTARTVQPEHDETIADEAIHALDAVEPPTAEPTLLLQKMENRLVRHHLAAPDVLSSEELRRLRYILNFARLADFEPGAAGRAGRAGVGTSRSAPRSRRGGPGWLTSCSVPCARSATR